MRALIIILFFCPGLLIGQLHIPSNGIVHISDGADLQVGGDLENNGVLENLGTLSLFSDWRINNNFNGIVGQLQLLGGSMQTIALPTELILNRLTMDQAGGISLQGAGYRVSERLDLDFGVVTLADDVPFILGPSAIVSGGSEVSYFDGDLQYQGGGIKKFPLGKNGIYAPVSLLSVFGAGSLIKASYAPNTVSPVPGDSILGVSANGLWEMELMEGGTDPTRVEIEFNEDDLENFDITNAIRNRVKSPVLAFADNPAGPYETLGVSELTNTDSVSFGTIVSQKRLELPLGEKVYIATALAPLIPNDGQFFVPEAFSPAATDVKNQTFRIWGERIAEEGFALQIYNNLGILLYETNSFQEANENGWNGENQRTGVLEPPGVYYYTLRISFETGEVSQQQGAFYLVQ